MFAFQVKTLTGLDPKRRDGYRRRIPALRLAAGRVSALPPPPTYPVGGAYASPAGRPGGCPCHIQGFGPEAYSLSRNQ